MKETVPEEVEDWIDDRAPHWVIEVVEFRNRKRVFVIRDQKAGLVIARAVGLKRLMVVIEKIDKQTQRYGELRT